MSATVPFCESTLKWEARIWNEGDAGPAQGSLITESVSTLIPAEAQETNGFHSALKLDC